MAKYCCHNGIGKTGNLIFFPDRENTGNLAVTLGKILETQEKYFDCDY